jgi:hypothetical protein
MSSDTFHARHPGLVWSVDRPSEALLMRAALLAPRFHTLLDACLEFGAARVRAEWQILKDEGTPEARRAAPDVHRILCHIEEGFADAQA